MSEIQKFFLTTAFAASSLWAQLDVNSLSTRTVRAGQTWATINTSVDELILRIEMDRGVITTTAQVAYTPSQGLIYSSCLDSTCSKRGNALVPQDSLETTASFRLEDNSAITDLFLWVGAEKVRAALQPRGLASAQYESIVRRRRDPALLETWGNGNYNLRIFPNASLEQRRIEVVFVTGMEDEAGRFGARIPVIARRTINTFGLQYPVTVYPTKHIPRVTLAVSSRDCKTYDLSLGSLGTRQVGARPVEIALENLESLDSLFVSGEIEDCRGCATPWISSRERSGYFGLKTILARSAVRFEPEPTDRLVVLDVDNRTHPKNLDYARKLALLCLKAYGQAPFRANLGFRSAEGVRFLFRSPRSMDATTLAESVEALRSAQPISQADYSDAFSALRAHRMNPESRAALLYLNDENPDNLFWTQNRAYDAAAWSTHNATQIRRATEALADLRAANLALFGYWNTSRLYDVARQSGGYSLGSLTPYQYLIRDAADSAAFTFNMPALFGPERQGWNYYYYGWGIDIADLRVIPERGSVRDLVILPEVPSYGYYSDIGGIPIARMDAMAVAAPLPKAADALTATVPGRDSLKLRISGQFDRAQLAKLQITGTWGGLRFRQTVLTPLPHFSRAGSGGSALWAYQQSEAWGRDTETDYVPAFQTLARNYHVMNRQMSLLALEPGMELWDSMPNTPNQTTMAIRTMNGVSASDAMSMAVIGFPGGFTLDSLSLDEILSGRIASTIRNRTGTRTDFTVRQDAGQVRLTLSAIGNETPQFEIMDLSGRRLARILGTRNGDTWMATWNPVGRRGGFYAVTRTGETTVSRKFAVVR